VYLKRLEASSGGGEARGTMVVCALALETKGESSEHAQKVNSGVASDELRRTRQQEARSRPERGERKRRVRGGWEPRWEG
jgi:hypothetical protein